MLSDTYHHQHLHIQSYRCRFWLVLVFLISGLSYQQGHAKDLFVTWKGIGPDKWASVWLIKTHINPNAEIHFIPIGSHTDAGISFDIPKSQFVRDTSTAYAKLMKHFKVNNPVAREIDTIMHDIEINAWGKSTHPLSDKAETAYRELQTLFGRREDVPFSCYIALFDNITAAISKNQLQQNSAKSLIPASSCSGVEKLVHTIPLVTEMYIDNILNALMAGKNVVFLDARENSEYTESHIPGAINVKLRDIDANLSRRFKDADIVIPYCIKDFRAYEVARALAKYGLNNTVIMRPFGLKGWNKLNLPLAGDKALSEKQAAAKLRQCTLDRTLCLSS